MEEANQKHATVAGSSNPGPNLTTVPEKSNPPTKIIKKYLNKPVVAVLVIVVLAVSFFALLSYYNDQKNEPQAVARKMITAIIKNDKALATSLTSSVFNKNTSQAELDNSISQISPFIKNGSYQLHDRYAWLDSGQISSESLVYKISSQDKTYYMRLLLTKESDGKWKVSLFRIRETELKANET